MGFTKISIHEANARVAADFLGQNYARFIDFLAEIQYGYDPKEAADQIIDNLEGK